MNRFVEGSRIGEEDDGSTAEFPNDSTKAPAGAFVFLCAAKASGSSWDDDGARSALFEA